MKTLNLALTALLSLTGISCAHTKVSSPAQKIYTFESDANGFNTKNFFYDNGQEVVVFDAQFTPEIAKKSIEFLRTKTQNPITFVIVTHPNPDKFNGASVFQKLGAKVISSQKTAQNLPCVHAYKKYYLVEMAKMFTEQTYPQEARIDITFNQKHDLSLGNGEVIRLQELSSAGVSTNQTVAIIPQANAVVVGDLVHHKAHAWLEGGIVDGKATPTINGWIADLKELASIVKKGTLVYGGRGEVVDVEKAVPAQIDYLKRADEVVTKLAKKSGDQTAAIQAELEKNFPEYGLSYMIQYGVYGLVQSKR
jgi:glyoxylase-like metal-dependent hydrolase (beta-lactamase superfamily II)